MTLSKNYQFEGIITLLSSLSHIGETIGTDAILRREKIIQPDKSIEEVAILSGNAFRGQLRDCGMMYFVENVNIETMPLTAFYFLFSGGTLTATGGRGWDVDLMLKMRKLIPFVSIMGGAWGNQIMAGKLACGKMYPLTKECARQIPEKFHSELSSSWRTWVQEEEYTRTDDAKNLEMKALIAPGETSEKPQQMRYSIETIAAGAQFYHRMNLYRVSEIELGSFCSALSQFSKKPYLGGMHRIGLGRVSMKYNHCEIGTDIMLDEECQSAKDKYDEYLQEYTKALATAQNEIKEVLEIAPVPAAQNNSNNGE